MSSSTSSRARRIFGGWSANVAGLVLALTQQIVLIPLFLKYWTGETLSAWLAVFAAGNLVLAADAGLHAWSLNRFLSFKSRDDCDRRSNRFYRAMLQLFVHYTLLVLLATAALFAIIAPSRVLGFSAEPHFDVSFAIMTLGMILTLPSNLASALYRARGLYRRATSIQAWGLAIGQVAQAIGIVLTGSLLVVATAFIAGQMVTAVYIALIDLRRQFPFLGTAGRLRKISWRWAVAQFGGALPFSVANAAELGLSWLSVLLIGVFVSDRIAIAQWGLTRTIVNLLRQVSFQATLPLAAELGYDHVIGARESLQRLYIRGSIIIVLVASAATSGALPFWPDFFAIWTHGAIPYDRTLTITLLLGTCAATPALLALSYANYSDRGSLLLRVKAVQLLLFLGLSVLLIPRFGPLGAAIALISSDLIAQSGFLLVVIARETLARPLRYVVIMLGMMVTIVSVGAALGEVISNLVAGGRIGHFVTECVLWIAAVAILASPLARRGFREKLLVALFGMEAPGEKTES